MGKHLGIGLCHTHFARHHDDRKHKLRPAVISHTTRDSLDEYRGFRHVVRNVYAFNLNPFRMRHLIEGLAHTFEQVEQEPIAFAKILDSTDG